jgi:hypothetical protein
MSNRGAISSTQRHAEATQRSSEVIRGTQRHSKALRCTQRHSDAIRRNQRHSDALRRNQRQSAALTSTQRALSSTQRAPGPETAIEDPDCQRHHWWRDGGARARLLRHRRAHLPVPFAADDPRSAALVLRVPAPQFGETPADLAAKSNRNAEVKAFFASGQVRLIRVQSEGTQRSSEGTQRALRGHSEATRGTHWPSEGSQRPVSGTQRGHPRRSEGTQRHSQAIRRHSDAILGHHSQSAALRRTRWQSRGRRDPRRPRWPHRVLSVRRVRVCVRVRVFAALAGDAWAVCGGGGRCAARG